MTGESNIFATLEKIGVASEGTRELYSNGTRDQPGLSVYRDRLSGVIYIDDFYTGDATYAEGAYRQQTFARAGQRALEDDVDVLRRSQSYKQFYAGKDIVEFGCGEGHFLREIRQLTQSAVGIELQSDCIADLQQDGINCHRSLDALEPGSVDAVFGFHVLEHLPDPIAVLGQLGSRLKSGGVGVFEVPHAGDFLLSHLNCEAFGAFTLWSQHLVLHTRESLRRLLEASGYTDVVVEGVQRYPLSNHLQWLTKGQPGGHKSLISLIETADLAAAYQASLQKLDATDTLVAVARKI